VLIRRWIQRVRSLLNDATLARPTNWQLSRCGWTGGPPLPAPLTHWELITVQWIYSGYRLPTHVQAASRWIRVSTIVKDRRSSVHQLFIALLDSEKFNARYREMFSSLASLVNIPNVGSLHMVFTNTHIYLQHLHNRKQSQHQPKFTTIHPAGKRTEVTWTVAKLNCNTLLRESTKISDSIVVLHTGTLLLWLLLTVWNIVMSSTKCLFQCTC